MQPTRRTPRSFPVGLPEASAAAEQEHARSRLRLGSVDRLGGEGVGEFVDLFEEVGEDALGLLAAAGG